MFNETPNENTYIIIPSSSLNFVYITVNSFNLWIFLYVSEFKIFSDEPTMETLKIAIAAKLRLGSRI